MQISTEVEFKSAPPAVRRAIMDYVLGKYPKAADFITWDATGTRARGSKMGASGTLELSGEGPTLVRIEAKIGFPASLTVSRSKIQETLDRAVRDLKKTTP